MSQLRTKAPATSFLTRAGQSFWRYRAYWLMVLPGLIFYLVFAYLPIYGVQIAFRDYTFAKGIWHSDWVGLRNFQDLFRIKRFWVAVRNTFIISGGRLLFEFPVPIIIAILLNEI
ncbi:MAG: hypothetical protein ACOYI6_04465 [Christensenellales bacterium]|jgi:putative aldouronate transport system permease protein